MKLNLGCGQNRREGYINVDKHAACAPDIVFDLETFPWPFDNDSIEEIVMHHALEHMGASVNVFLAIMKELYRICAPEAKIHITVPHPRSESYMGDPTHVRPITLDIMALFSKKNNRQAKELGWPNTPLATYLDIDFEIARMEYTLTPYWLQQLQSGKLTREDIDFACATYFNVVSEISLTLVCYK